MQNITAGVKAGFVATIVLSAMMLAKGMMGLMPGLDPIVMMSAMMGAPAIMGWVAHFMIGSLAWGIGFAVLYDFVPGNSAVAKGISWGVGAWLAMMIAVMPMAGAGFFGMSLGVMAPMMTLVMHLVFGIVLGAVYAMTATQGAEAA